jgi:multiple sugar transport system permease protein
VAHAIPSRPYSPRLRRNVTGYLFATPWFIGFFVFTAGPMLASLYLSFTDYDVTSSRNWVGLRNYVELTTDPLIRRSLGNTAYYSLLAVPLGIVTALFFAVLLNQGLPGTRLLRTIYFLPSVTSGVAVSLLWLWLLDPSYGAINDLLRSLGLRGPLWLQHPSSAKPALVLMSVWSIGNTIVIFLAGLQGIPQQLYEAAAIDGAGVLRRFWHITLPMMTPTIFFTLVMGVIGSFQVFTQAYVMTQGGPNNATLFYVYYLYQQAFAFVHMGYASAMAWLLFAIILALTLIVFRSATRWVYYEGGRA